jgi:hypothetical protein
MLPKQYEDHGFNTSARTIRPACGRYERILAPSRLSFCETDTTLGRDMISETISYARFASTYRITA